MCNSDAQWTLHIFSSRRHPTSSRCWLATMSSGRAPREEEGALSRVVYTAEPCVHHRWRFTTVVESHGKTPRESASFSLLFSSLSSRLLYPSLSSAHSGSMCAVLARAIQTPIDDLLALLTTTFAFCWPRRCAYMYTVDPRRRRDTAQHHYCTSTALPRLRSLGFSTRAAGLSIVAVNVFGLKSPGGDFGILGLSATLVRVSLAVIEGRNRG